MKILENKKTLTKFIQSVNRKISITKIYNNPIERNIRIFVSRFQKIRGDPPIF